MKPQEILSKMNTRQKAGQLLLRACWGAKDDLNYDFQKMNETGELGGLILFSSTNIANLEQTRTLSRNIQNRVSENPLEIPFFLAIDQEGGQLSPIYKGNTIFPGNMNLGFLDDVSWAEKLGEYIGRQVRYAGGNINCAPVLDISYDSLNNAAIVDNRMISSHPENVAEMGVAFIKGAEKSGIISCAKHFPGMRPVLKDTHHALDVIEYDMKRLEAIELLPFRKAIAAGVPSVMTHHAIYKAIDDLPGTLSPKMVKFLRSKLGFEGLIISDDVKMAALDDHFGEEAIIEKVINAGINQICTTGETSWISEFVEDGVKKGTIDEDVLNDSVLRVLKAKEEYKIGEEFAEKVNTPTEKTFAKSLAQKTLVKVKSDLEGPIVFDKEDKIAVVLGNPTRVVMSDTVNRYSISFKQEILARGLCEHVTESIMPLVPTPEETFALSEAAMTANKLIFCTTNAFHFQKQIKVLKMILRNPDLKIIGIAMRSPEDVRFLKPLCDEVYATGGTTPATITAMVDTLFGMNEAIDNTKKRVLPEFKEYLSYSTDKEDFLHKISQQDFYKPFVLKEE